MAKSNGFRIRIVDSLKNTSYIVRQESKSQIHYMTASETPLALSNLVSTSAAELRFKLEDAPSGDVATQIVRDTLRDMWRNNPSQCPTVTWLG